MPRHSVSRLAANGPQKTRRDTDRYVGGRATSLPDSKRGESDSGTACGKYERCLECADSETILFVPTNACLVRSQCCIRHLRPRIDEPLHLQSPAAVNKDRGSQRRRDENVDGAAVGDAPIARLPLRSERPIILPARRRH